MINKKVSQFYRKYTIDKLDEPGYYIEASGAIEGILRKAGEVQVTDEETIQQYG